MLLLRIFLISLQRYHHSLPHTSLSSPAAGYCFLGQPIFSTNALPTFEALTQQSLATFDIVIH